VSITGSTGDEKVNKRSSIALLLATFMILTSACHAQRWKSKITDLYEDWDEKDKPGAMVYIVEDGEVKYSKGFGMANIEEQISFDSKTLFNIASTSKQFTGAAIAMLVEEGKLDLAADIRSILDFLPDYGHTIRVSNLVHHTSGLIDVLGVVDEKQFENGWGNPEVIPLFAELNELKFEPGTKFDYSNSNYILMAEIVERLSGQSFREFVNERIFVPLGMSRARVDDDLKRIDDTDVAQSYAKRRGAYNRYERDDFLVGDGNVVVSVEDMAKWAQNLSTHNVGSDAFHDLILSTEPLNSGDTNDYAFGIFIGEYEGKAAYTHGGSWLGFRCYFGHFPDDNVTILIFGNNNRQNLYQGEVAEIFFGRKRK
jgi:CubicO group peptidase (beta-lactamase class C family)